MHFVLRLSQFAFGLAFAFVGLAEAQAREPLRHLTGSGMAALGIGLLAVVAVLAVGDARRGGKWADAGRDEEERGV